MLHVPFHRSGDVEGIHDVHPGGVNGHKDLASARLGDRDLMDGAVGPEFVDGEGSHKKVWLLAGRGSFGCHYPRACVCL